MELIAANTPPSVEGGRAKGTLATRTDTVRCRPRHADRFHDSAAAYGARVHRGVWETMIAVLVMAALGAIFRLLFDLVFR